MSVLLLRNLTSQRYLIYLDYPNILNKEDTFLTFLIIETYKIIKSSLFNMNISIKIKIAYTYIFKHCYPLKFLLASCKDAMAE